MNKKIIYPLAIICCLSVFSFAGNNKKNCLANGCAPAEAGSPVKNSPARDKEIDVLSPLHFFLSI